MNVAHTQKALAHTKSTRTHKKNSHTHTQKILAHTKSTRTYAFIFIMQICPSWSKGFDLSSNVERLVGSNPTICNAFIAQLVEHYTCNVKVSGSNPDEGYCVYFFQILLSSMVLLCSLFSSLQPTFFILLSISIIASEEEVI